MSRDRIEPIVRSAYAARVRGDLDAVMRHFGEGAHFTLAGSPAASPVPASATGIAAVREVMRRLMEGFAFAHAEILTLIVDGDDAAVHSRLRLRTPDGQEVQTEVVDVIRMAGDKIVSFKQFADTALAARLLGT